MKTFGMGCLKVENRFFADGELKDKKIEAALKKAAKDYANGEIVETRDLILEIAAAIYQWEKAEYGAAPYCPLCGAHMTRR